MGSFRFYRRVHVFPGLSVNLSKSGPSLTVGMRGAHMTFGRRGMTRTVGLPGTGIYYTSRRGYHTGVHSAHNDAPVGASMRSAVESVLILVMFGVAVVIVLGAALAVVAMTTHPR